MFRLSNNVFHRDDRICRQKRHSYFSECVYLSLQAYAVTENTLRCTVVELHGFLGDLLLVSARKPHRKELLFQDLGFIFMASNGWGLNV